MSKPDESSVSESMAGAQDTLYLIEESARGLRTKMRENGWSDDASEAIAAQWFSRALGMSMDHADTLTKGDTKDTVAQLFGKVVVLFLALLTLPAIVILCIAGWRWATG